MSTTPSTHDYSEAQIGFVSASAFSFGVLADLLTRSFAGYWYPVVATAESLAQSVRVEHIDIYRSIVMELDGQPAGLAMLSLRAARAWCARFGILEPFRGRGLSHRLTEAMIEQARVAGAQELMLEVLVRNIRAVAAYRRAGLRTRRDLLILEWRAPDVGEAQLSTAGQDELEQIEAGQLLRHFVALHAVPMPWQRDLPALLVRDGLQGMGRWNGAALSAYALIRIDSAETMWLIDVGATTSDEVAMLFGLLQRRCRRIVCINEPDDSPLLPGFQARGFVEIDRQHEMELIFEAYQP